MTNDEWDSWDEWLAHDHTRRFLALLRVQSRLTETAYKDALFNFPQDALAGDYPHMRARALVYKELSEIGRVQLEGMMDDEHDGD